MPPPSPNQPIPSPLTYPPIATRFPNSTIFTKTYRKLFQHARNRVFVGLNNTSSAIYICPNYATCGGVLHGVYKRLPQTDRHGNILYDSKGRIRTQNNAPLLISDLTHPCSCGPPTFSSLTQPHLFPKLKGITNIPRSEFARLAHTYFLPGGPRSYKYMDIGTSITWRCLVCRRGMLTLRKNVNAQQQSPKFQPCGTITHAQPCPSTCPTHRNGVAPKCFWFPRPRKLSASAVTQEDTLRATSSDKEWTALAKQIARQLLVHRVYAQRHNRQKSQILHTKKHHLT